LAQRLRFAVTMVHAEPTIAAISPATAVASSEDAAAFPTCGTALNRKPVPNAVVCRTLAQRNLPHKRGAMLAFDVVVKVGG
jgi:hypothetical protein